MIFFVLALSCCLEDRGNWFFFGSSPFENYWANFLTSLLCLILFTTGDIIDNAKRRGIYSHGLLLEFWPPTQNSQSIYTYLILCSNREKIDSAVDVRLGINQRINEHLSSYCIHHKSSSTKNWRHQNWRVSKNQSFLFHPQKLNIDRVVPSTLSGLGKFFKVKKVIGSSPLTKNWAY